MFEHLKKFCDSLVEMGLPGSDLAIFKDGECVFRNFSGFSDLENKIKVNGKERYNIYSCSKPITCTAALQLWEKGMFSLDDKLSDYMPEFAEMTVKTEDGVKKAEKPILIKHLFEMTAGFSYSVSSPYMIKCKEDTNGRCPTREVMKYLAKEPLLFEPGENWQYSLCHDVLAALVEVLTDEKFEDYIKKNIFDVLGMNDSTFMLPDDELDTIAQQYIYKNNKPVNIGKSIYNYKIGSEYASGGAGCISTVDDYMKFLEALRTNVLLKKETVDLLTINRLSSKQMANFSKKSTHGYSLGFRCPNGIKYYDDFGWGGAAGAFLSIDRDRNMSIYMGMHIISSPVQGLRQMVYRFARAELFDMSELDSIYEELKGLIDYNFTF